MTNAVARQDALEEAAQVAENWRGKLCSVPLVFDEIAAAIRARAALVEATKPDTPDVLDDFRMRAAAVRIIPGEPVLHTIDRIIAQIKAEAERESSVVS